MNIVFDEVFDTNPGCENRIFLAEAVDRLSDRYKDLAFNKNRSKRKNNLALLARLFEKQLAEFDHKVSRRYEILNEIYGDFYKPIVDFFGYGEYECSAFPFIGNSRFFSHADFVFRNLSNPQELHVVNLILTTRKNVFPSSKKDISNMKRFREPFERYLDCYFEKSIFKTVVNDLMLSEMGFDTHSFVVIETSSYSMIYSVTQERKQFISQYINELY